MECLVAWCAEGLQDCVGVAVVPYSNDARSSRDGDRRCCLQAVHLQRCREYAHISCYGAGLATVLLQYHQY